MRRRRRFSGDLKAKVALEAFRGDLPLQEIASKHQVHPNQVSTWKRQAIEGLGEVFSSGVDRRRRDHESEVHELHAKGSSQFTGFAFTGRLQAAGVRISMDGRGRCMDNIFIERLWRSLKYEAVYLHDLADGFEARLRIDEWIGFYNTERPHSALAGKTPAEDYRSNNDRQIYPRRFWRYQ